MLAIAENWTLDHIGHAVKDLDESIQLYTRFFGFVAEHREFLPEHNVEVAFMRFANSRIELLCPRKENEALQKFLSKRGPGLHHVAFEVKSIPTELARLESLGARLIDRAPRPGAENTQVAFIHPQEMSGVLIELVSRSSQGTANV